MASVLADFTGRFVAEAADFEGPVEGRVVLGNDQLVLAASDDERVPVPLDSVFDINVGYQPKAFDPIGGTPVTVAYRDGHDRVAAVVAADENTVEKFATVLFKATLNGTAVTIKHPAKVGGRVMDSEFKGGILALDSGTVKFETDEGPVAIGLDDVVDFDREKRDVDGEVRPLLIVSHVDTGEAMTTLAATDSTPKLSILGRYLQRTYRKRMASLENLSLSEPETETLATLYSARGMDVSLGSVLGVSPKKVKRILHALHQKGLIESEDGGPVLTAKGQIVVNHYLERVNT
jgi:helix-turn-helix protein